MGFQGKKHFIAVAIFSIQTQSFGVLINKKPAGNWNFKLVNFLSSHLLQRVSSLAPGLHIFLIFFFKSGQSVSEGYRKISVTVTPTALVIQHSLNDKNKFPTIPTISQPPSPNC